MEDLVAKGFAEAFRCAATATPTTAPFDYWLEQDGAICAILEVRRRRCNHNTYESLYMGFHKWDQLITIAHKLHKPMIFAVQFDDGVYWMDLTRYMQPKTGYVSRGATPKGGARATDNELSVFLRTEWFKRLP